MKSFSANYQKSTNEKTAAAMREGMARMRDGEYQYLDNDGTPQRCANNTDPKITTGNTTPDYPLQLFYNV